MLSCIVQNRVQQDGPTTDDKFQHFTYLRKLDKVPLPYDIHNKIKNKSIQVFRPTFQRQVGADEEDDAPGQVVPDTRPEG